MIRLASFGVTCTELPATEVGVGQMSGTLGSQTVIAGLFLRPHFNYLGRFSPIYGPDSKRQYRRSFRAHSLRRVASERLKRSQAMAGSTSAQVCFLGAHQRLTLPSTDAKGLQK